MADSSSSIIKHRRHKPSSSSSSSDEESYTDSSISSSSSESESESDERHHHKSSSSTKRKRRRDSHKTAHHSKHHKHSDSTKRHKKKGKKKKSSKPDKISEKDYFLKSSEFRKWLSQEKELFFSDLDSTDTRQYFKSFVSKWNSGRLKSKYYRSVQSSSLDHSGQTAYKWKFTGDEQKSLTSMRKMVSSWTASAKTEEESKPRTHSSAAPKLMPEPTKDAKIKPVIGPMLPPMISKQSSDPFEEEEMRELEKKKHQRDRREYRKQKELVLDELLPKATGKEARFEKKKIRAEQRREREVSPDIGDSSLMGTSQSIHVRIKARQETRHNRAQAAAQKVSDYEAKERARVNAILEMAKANKKDGSLW